MTFDNTQPTASDALSLTELDLYHLIMDYRAANGLDAIPLSLNLTTTGGRHAADTLYNIWQAGLSLPQGANLHSWSDAPYYSDHSDPDVMWSAPTRIGTNYTDYGFEISAAGYSGIEAALNGWKGSSGHNDVILNNGIWANSNWNAIGIGVEIDTSVSNYGGKIYHVWFGRSADPDGSSPITGTTGTDTVIGTQFADTILGRGGRDDLVGDAGHDVIKGAGGKDTIKGGAGKDKLIGGAGNDVIFGHNGRDVLDGGTGNDVLKGGAHKDVFIFRANFGEDRIKDYDGDKIRIKAPGEAASEAELSAALSDQNGNAVYDHLNDGENVIIFEGVSVASLDLSLFDLG
ncbi:hypothetical protein ACXYMO_04295 [Arenibacterium sp. CAU 1754]